MPDYSWPAQDSRRLMGKRISRIDGREKASGRAKYASDLNKPGLLFGALLTCPHAHAKVVSIDTSDAKNVMPNVLTQNTSTINMLRSALERT